MKNLCARAQKAIYKDPATMIAMGKELRKPGSRVVGAGEAGRQMDSVVPRDDAYEARVII